MAKNKYGGINDMPSGWTKGAENKKVYMLWFDMLRRCYDDEQLKRSKGKSYENCSVCDEWFNLSTIYEDIQKLNGYEEWKANGKMSIDKDIFSNGAKKYSPKTCCFIPISENLKEMNKRNLYLMDNLHKAKQTKYVLSKGNSHIKFNSEKSACEYLNVRQCTVSSCYRRSSKCKGFDIARMDGDTNV